MTLTLECIFGACAGGLAGYLAAWLAGWLAGGFRLASTAVHLPRYRAFQGTYYRATEQRGIPRTALPRACGSTTAGDLEESVSKTSKT